MTEEEITGLDFIPDSFELYGEPSWGNLDSELWEWEEFLKERMVCYAM